MRSEGNQPLRITIPISGEFLVWQTSGQIGNGRYVRAVSHADAVKAYCQVWGCKDFQSFFSMDSNGFVRSANIKTEIVVTLQ